MSADSKENHAAPGIFPGAAFFGPAGKSTAAQNLTTEAFAAVEIAAGLRAAVVDGAEARGPIQGHAGAVAVLVHAAHAGVHGDQFLGNDITRPELDHQVAATAAAGARRKVGMG